MAGGAVTHTPWQEDQKTLPALGWREGTDFDLFLYNSDGVTVVVDQGDLSHTSHGTFTRVSITNRDLIEALGPATADPWEAATRYELRVVPKAARTNGALFARVHARLSDATNDYDTRIKGAPVWIYGVSPSRSVRGRGARCGIH